MAITQRQLVALLLLFFLIVSSTAVPISRSLKAVKNQVLFGNLPSQLEKEDEEVSMERRMSMQLEDYPGTGANRNHDPRPPGGRF